MAVTKRTRYEVLRRDNHTCRYCGGTAPDVVLTIDHVTPVALGGTDLPDNLVTACADCNSGKASTSPEASLVSDVKQADIRWAAAIRRAADITTNDREQITAYVEAFDGQWRWATPTNLKKTTLTNLRAAGLPLEEMLDALDITANARGVDSRWSYFCGVAWNKVTALQQIAKSLLAAEDMSGS